MEKKKVIFVDDEHRILDGMRRMLRSMRDQWEITFVLGGKEALERIQKEHFDVLISDMRMSGMDGAELLARVKEYSPGTVRIILSGQAEKGVIMRTVGSAHQYLAKPCDKETLVSTVNRALALRALLSQEQIVSLVSRIDTLPSLPTTYTRILEALEDPDSRISRIGEIVSEDLAMTAKILQLVNSAFFGNLRSFSNVSDAVVFLGLDTIKSLVLTVGLFSQFNQVSVLNPQRLFNHGLRTGAIARRIARSESVDKSTAESAFFAALLHDIGKLVLADNLPDLYLKAQELSNQEQVAMTDAEKRVFGATHAEVGAYLMGLWAMAETSIEAIAFHHQSPDLPRNEILPVTIVKAANVLAHQVESEAESPPQSELDFFAEQGLEQRFTQWLQIAQTETATNVE